jgi:hypothetical protein
MLRFERLDYFTFQEQTQLLLNPRLVSRFDILGLSLIYVESLEHMCRSCEEASVSISQWLNQQPPYHLIASKNMAFNEFPDP